MPKATKNLYKYQVAAMIGISMTTLRMYINKKYLPELQKFGYTNSQKQLTPKQINFLNDKLDFLD